jgi:hypothetical protein
LRSALPATHWPTLTTAPTSSLALSVYNAATNAETGYDLGILGVDFDLSDQDQLLFSRPSTSATLASTVCGVQFCQHYGYKSTFGLATDITAGVCHGSTLSQLWNTTVSRRL